MIAARYAVLGAAVLGLVGCASQSGYSLDIRNGTGEMGKIDVTSQTKDGEPKLVESMRITPGHNGTVFTKADGREDRRGYGERPRPQAPDSGQDGPGDLHEPGQGPAAQGAEAGDSRAERLIRAGF